MEMEIPIPSLPSLYCLKHLCEIMATYLDGDPDWNIVSRAWWDAVDLIQKSAEDKVFACDMTLELRVMGGSEV